MKIEVLKKALKARTVGCPWLIDYPTEPSPEKK